MAKLKNRKRGRKSRRPIKVEIKRQKVLQCFILAIVTAVIFFFAIARLGIFGITAYNIARFVVGSLAYSLMFAVLIYSIGFRWFHKQTGLVGGFVATMTGSLFEWYAYLFSLIAYHDKEVFPITTRSLYDDIINFKVSGFVGGGMLDAVLYKPVAFLFSNIGTFLIGALFITLRLFLMSPWEVYDIVEFFKEKSQEWAAKSEIRKQKRSVEREEKKALIEQKRQEKTQKEGEKRLAQTTVDQGAGKILENPTDNKTSLLDNLLENDLPTGPEILAYSHTLDGLEEPPLEGYLTMDSAPSQGAA